MSNRGLVHSIPFFYGHVVLVAGTLGLVMTSPGQTYAISIFIDSMMTDLGLSRSEISGLYTCATLLSGLGLSWLGRQIDRFGCRPSVAVFTLGLAGACFLTGKVNGVTTLFFAFLMLRFFGQGGMGLVSNNVINQWWVRRRGRMMGLAGMLAMLGGIGLFPPIIDVLISQFGWRRAYFSLGLGLLLVMLPVGLGLYRERPEKYGLNPDGEASTLRESGGIQASEDWTQVEAMKTSAFWVVGSALALMAMLITGLHFHVVSLFEAGGQDRTLAAHMYFPMAAIAAVLALVGGVLKDRLQVRLLLSLALLLLGATMLLAGNLASLSGVWTYTVMLGVTSGLFQVVGSVVWADLFGRLHLGAISGTATTMVVAGSALGPLPLALAQDRLGGYGQALLLLSLLPFALALATLFLRLPQRAERQAGDR